MEGRCRGAFHPLRTGRKDIPHYVWRGRTSRIMRGEGGYLFICRGTSHYMYREGVHLVIYREGGHLVICREGGHLVIYREGGHLVI